MKSPRFPILAEMDRDMLAIPISSVASESAFSTGGHILDSFRSSLTPKLVQALVCCQDWLRSDSFPIEIEEDLNYLEQFELDLTEWKLFSHHRYIIISCHFTSVRTALFFIWVQSHISFLMESVLLGNWDVAVLGDYLLTCKVSYSKLLSPYSMLR